MNAELSTLEAAILNLEAAEQGLLDQMSLNYQKIAAEVSAQITKLPGDKRVIVRAAPIRYENGGVTGGFSVESETANDIKSDVKRIIDVVGKPYEEKNGNLYEKIMELGKRKTAYMVKLAPFTEVEVVREGVVDHAHIFTVRGDKIHAGQLILGIGAYMAEFDTDEKGLERFKKNKKCPLYVARHPSRLIDHMMMTAYTCEFILKSLNESKKK